VRKEEHAKMIVILLAVRANDLGLFPFLFLSDAFPKANSMS